MRLKFSVTDKELYEILCIIGYECKYVLRWLDNNEKTAEAKDVKKMTDELFLLHSLSLRMLKVLSKTANRKIKKTATDALNGYKCRVKKLKEQQEEEFFKGLFDNEQKKALTATEGQGDVL